MKTRLLKKIRRRYKIYSINSSTYKGKFMNNSSFLAYCKAYENFYILCDNEYGDEYVVECETSLKLIFEILLNKIRLEYGGNFEQKSRMTKLFF